MKKYDAKTVSAAWRRKPAQGLAPALCLPWSCCPRDGEFSVISPFMSAARLTSCLGPMGPARPIFVWFAFFAVPLGASISALFVPLRLTSCLHRDHLTHGNQWVPPATLRPRNRNRARNSFRLGLPDCRRSSLLSRLPVCSPAPGLAALCGLGVNHSPPLFYAQTPQKTSNTN